MELWGSENYRNSIIHRFCGPRLHTRYMAFSWGALFRVQLYSEFILFAEWEYDDVDREQRGPDGLAEKQ